MTARATDRRAGERERRIGEQERERRRGGEKEMGGERKGCANLMRWRGSGGRVARLREGAGRAPR